MNHLHKAGARPSSTARRDEFGRGGTGSGHLGMEVGDDLLLSSAPSAHVSTPPLPPAQPSVRSTCSKPSACHAVSGGSTTQIRHAGGPQARRRHPRQARTKRAARMAAASRPRGAEGWEGGSTSSSRPRGAGRAALRHAGGTKSRRRSAGGWAASGPAREGATKDRVTEPCDGDRRASPRRPPRRPRLRWVRIRGRGRRGGGGWGAA